MAGTVNEAGIFIRAQNLPLMADMQYMEPYSSSALNRKMLGIILPGVFRGFDVKPGAGLNIVISSTADGTGAACIEVGGYQITVQQTADVTVPITKGQTTIVALEANYGQGTLTKQVSAGAALDAARFVTIAQGQPIKANQIEICRVTLSASATSITQDNINMETRTRRRVGPVISDAIDSREQFQVASSNAVRLAIEAGLIEVNKRVLRGEGGLGVDGLTLDQAFDWQNHIFKGGEYVYFNWSQAKGNPALGYPGGYYQIFTLGMSQAGAGLSTVIIRPVNYNQPLAPFLISWTGAPGSRVFKYRAISTSLQDINQVSGVTPNTLNAMCFVGEFAQQNTSSAIVANGYPVAEAGTLRVMAGTYGVMQEYTTFSSTRRFVRGMSSAGVFAGWVEYVRASDLQSAFNAVNIGTNNVPLISNFDWQQFDIKSGGIITAVTSNWKNVPDGLVYTGTWNVAIQCTSSTSSAISLRVIPLTNDKAQLKEYNVTLVGGKGSRTFTVQRTLNDSDTTNSTTDTRTGQLLKVGDFGVGGQGISIADPAINGGTPKKLMELLKAKGSGFYRLNRPAPTGFKQDSPFIFTYSGDTMFTLQVEYSTGIVSATAANNASLTADQVKVNTLYGTENKPSPDDVLSVPQTIRGTISNGGKFASANKTGWWTVAIDNVATVSDIPKKEDGTPVYGYGYLYVHISGSTWIQHYYSHRSEIAHRQDWTAGPKDTVPWVLDYNQSNKPTPADVGALALTGGELSGQLAMKRGAGSVTMRMYCDNSVNDYGALVYKSAYDTLAIGTTSEGAALAGYAAATPVTINLATGRVRVSAGLMVGNALTNDLGNNSIVVGDSDTGLRWNSDGNFDLMANSKVIANINTGGVTLPVNMGLVLGGGSTSYIGGRSRLEVLRNGIVTTDAGFQPMVRQDQSDRKFVIGGLGKNYFGIFMYLNSRKDTDNSFDTAAYLNAAGWYSSNDLSCGGAITAGTTITAGSTIKWGNAGANLANDGNLYGTQFGKLAGGTATADWAGAAISRAYNLANTANIAANAAKTAADTAHSTAAARVDSIKLGAIISRQFWSGNAAALGQGDNAVMVSITFVGGGSNEGTAYFRYLTYTANGKSVTVPKT